MPTPGDLAERATAGLHAHWRLQCGYIDGGEVAEHDGVLVTATRLPDETLNVAFAPGAVPDPEAALNWVERWFAERGMKPGIELRVGHQPALERLLATRGWTVVVRRPAMTLHPLVVPPVTVPGAVARVAGPGDLAAFQAIQAEVFEMTPEVTAAFLPPRALEHVTLLLASVDGVPCATAAVSVSPYGAGIVGVATLPVSRRRGLGRLVTAAAIRAGQEQGADLAWLYPTAMARTLYEGLGFQALDETQVWVSP